MTGLSDKDFFSRFLAFLDGERAMLGIPGAGVALRRGGNEFCGGLGLLDSGESRTVTERSLFAIASCSKAFTTTVCARLVERGLLDWDRPVRRYWPDFAFGSEALAAAVTLRDLCANRTGIGRASAVEYGSVLSFEQVVEGAGGLPTVAPLRDRYTYSNLHFTIAAALCARVAGRPFADILAEEVLLPLGMADASTAHAGLAADARFARPHVRHGNGYRAIPLVNLDNLIGAGSVSLTPKDAASWLRFHLGAHAAGDEVLPSHARAALYRFQTRTLPEDGFLGYALGWRVGPGGDPLVVEHTGAIDGALSMMRFVPGAGLGLFLSFNADGPEVMDLRNVAADLAVSLARCEARTADTLISDARAALATMRAGYRRDRWAGGAPAPASVLSPGTFDGGPMGRLVLSNEGGGLTMSLELLPTYRYRVMEAGPEGLFPLRTLQAPERWWMPDEAPPTLRVADGGQGLVWQGMWFGDCAFRRC